MIGKIKAFLNKIGAMSPAARASFWFVVSNLVLKGMSFITTPIFTRLMEVEDYGATSVFVTWEGVINVFATLALSGGVFNVAQVKYKDDVPAYTSSMMTLSFLSSFVVYSLCVVFNLVVPDVFGLATPYLIFMWLQTFTSSAISFWLMRRRFLYDYKSVIAYTFVNALLSPAVAIGAILLFPGDAAMAKVVGAGLPGIVIGLTFVVINYVRGKRAVDLRYWKYALRFTIPLVPYALSGTILNSSDRLMVNSMVGKAEAGICSVSHSITGLVGIITQSINYSLIPYTMQSIKQKAFGNLKNVVLACVALASVVCFFVMMFAREGIMIFATVEYLDAVALIPPLTLATLFCFVLGILGNIMYYYEKTWPMSVVTIVCAILNVALNYVGILWFGYVATAWTTMICYFVQLTAYYFIVKRYEKNLNKIVDLRLFLAIVIIYVGFMLVAIVLQDLLWARLLLIAVAICVLVLMRKRIIEMFRSMKKKDAVKEENSAEEGTAA